MINLFDTFTMAELTAAINAIPNRYGRINEIGIFQPRPVTQRQVVIEEYSGRLSLLPTQPVGAPGTVAARGTRKARSFVVPHIPHEDVILPEEVQGIRAFGSQTETETVASILARRLDMMRQKHAITLEYLCAGALKGQILDADGTVLVNLFAEFGITQHVVNFALSNNSTSVRAKCADVIRHIEDNLMGEVYTGVHALCSPTFFDALVSHPKVEEAYKYAQGAVLAQDLRRGFTFGGITFEEYRGQATDANGNIVNFIGANEAYAFPLGTVDTFALYLAPADFNETVNTLGQPIYAKIQPRRFDRGVEIHTQSNPLPLCHRPGVLVKMTA